MTEYGKAPWWANERRWTQRDETDRAFASIARGLVRMANAAERASQDLRWPRPAALRMRAGGLPGCFIDWSPMYAPKPTRSGAPPTFGDMRATPAQGSNRDSGPWVRLRVDVADDEPGR